MTSQSTAPLQDGLFLGKPPEVGERSIRSELTQPVLGFDGDCPLCNRVVAFLLWADANHKLHYVTQQSRDGQVLLAQYDLPQSAGQDVPAIDAVWLATNECLYLGPTAVMQVLLLLAWPWRLVWFLMWLMPKPLRRWGYALVARNRKKLFGAYVCTMPAQKRWMG